MQLAGPKGSLQEKSYRTDIDGLRGIAVLSVIVFHIDSRILVGGFVGVDIFFAISGYLISLHILSDIQRERFSIAEFYRRRIKRIAPAMLAVVAFTLILSQILFLPKDAERIAGSALWALGSLANVYFWLHQDTSYFAAASSEQPLLHLWSLGVEEQFYLLWPLLLLALYRASSARTFVSWAIASALVSFALGDWLFDRYPSFVYYMLPTRAGELLVGALAAQWILLKGTEKPKEAYVQAMAIGGMTLVIGSLFLISEEQVFPGWRAMPPTIGTAALIVAGHHTTSWSARILCWRPLAWVGVVSYSAYLWHWPLLAFARYAGLDIRFMSGTALFVLTMAMAWLSYQYIEQPARRTSLGALQVAIRQYVAPAGILAVLALLAIKLDGYGPRWFSADYKARLSAMQGEVKPAFQYDYVCQRQLITARDVSDERCVVGDRAGGSPRVLLWGDSNAAHYIGMLGVFAQREGYVFRNLQVGSCPPIDQNPAEFVKANRIADCIASFEAIAPILDDYPVIWISANWTGYQERSSRFLDVFARMVEKMASRGTKVVILGKAPIIDGYDRLCWEKSVSLPFLECDVPAVPLNSDVVRVNSSLKAMAESVANVDYFDANEFLCSGGYCSATDVTGSRIYFDSSHIALDASWRLGEKIVGAGVPLPFRNFR